MNDINRVRNILSNELGVTREVVIDLIREQVVKHIKECGGLEGILRSIAREQVKEIARSERIQWGSVHSIVDGAVRDVLTPAVKSFLVNALNTQDDGK